MRRNLLIVMTVAFSFSANAQGWIEDSVTLENKSAKQIYYSFKTQNQHISDAVNWDLAFSVQNIVIPNSTVQATTIRLNNGKTVKVYVAPDSVDVSGFATLDTTNFKTSWTELLDSDTSWDMGAFNTGLDLTVPPSMGGPYYGWGNYEEGTHAIKSVGKVYLIVRGNVYRKLYFGDLEGDNVYHFTYADLDNNNQHSDSIKKSDYPDRYFVYYDLASNSVKNLEPSKADWDVVFTNYYTYAAGYNPILNQMQWQYMSVSGSLQKKGVKVARITDVHPDSAWSAVRNFSENIDNIGYDWKLFKNTYVYEDSLSFVIDNGGDTLYLLHFNKYGGSANVRMNFQFQKQAKPSGPVDGVASISLSNVRTYPNPVTSTLFVQTEQNAQVEVLDMNGRVLLNSVISPANNKIDMSALNNGLYILRVIQQNEVFTSKIIKTN